jgi:signal transduction histidine kinase
MVIVETIALSTMVSNDLVMPLLLRLKLFDPGERGDLARRLLAIRRGAIVGIVLLGYAYFRFAGEAYALVAIGLISFAAVAQFAPAMLGGIYWKHGTRAGALAGLAAGFTVWLYTLLLPSFARSGWLPQSFLDQGPWGVALLRPLELFGLSGLDQTTHAMVWSMLANVSVYVLVSLLGRPDPVTRAQAERFVDASRAAAEPLALRRGQVSLRDLEGLLARFLGAERTREAFAAYAMRRGAVNVEALAADAGLGGFAETQLAGAIGSASARVMVASLVKEEAPGLEEVMSILDETSQAIAYSKALEQKSHELEAATAELRAANERLQELDRMKDDFVSTVSHELRTPLTSIRAFAEMLFDRPDTLPEKRQQFLGIILKETERLTRLINQILDLAKIESGRAEWHTEALDMRELVRDAAAATSQLFADKGVAFETRLPERVAPVIADRDRLQQVLLNLLSNAVKFSPSHNALVRVALTLEPDRVRVAVNDNGPGIDPRDHESIFEKFRQVGDTLTDRPHGTGLGLPISRQIVRQFGGELWVESVPGEGATFSFTLPLASAAGGQ